MINESGAVPRMIPNPAWNESVELKQAKEATYWHYGEFPEDVFPEDYGKGLPEDGGWIILLYSVHVGKQRQDGSVKKIVVPHLSVWFAMIQLLPYR